LSFDRDDPSIVTQCRVKDVSRVAMNLVLLGPDRVVRKIIDADRFECTVTDMKRDLGGSRFHAREQRREPLL
jgi:hypothetical protein